MTAYSFLASTCFFALTCATFYHKEADYNWAWKDQTNLLIVLYAVCVCSFINYATICFANGHLDATVITMYAPVQTVVTVAIQFVRNGGSPSELLRDCAGMLVTTFGIWLVAKQPKAVGGRVEKAQQPKWPGEGAEGGKMRIRGALTPLL